MFAHRRQVLSGVSEDVEVHTDMVTTLRSIFVQGRDTTSISEGFLGSVRELAGAVLAHSLRTLVCACLLPGFR